MVKVGNKSYHCLADVGHVISHWILLRLQGIPCVGHVISATVPRLLSGSAAKLSRCQTTGCLRGRIGNVLPVELDSEFGLSGSMSECDIGKWTKETLIIMLLMARCTASVLDMAALVQLFLSVCISNFFHKFGSNSRLQHPPRARQSLARQRSVSEYQDY